MVDFIEIISGGPTRDGSSAVSAPRFRPAAEVTDLPGTEPVIVVTIDGRTRAYPVRMLMRHEIVNDTLRGVPRAVTYCPLCNAGRVFERRVVPDGAPTTLGFGVSGQLRHSELIYVEVIKANAAGERSAAPDIVFAFAFEAFTPGGVIHVE